MRLSELKTGEKGVIVKVLGHGGFRKRIVEMGFIRGKIVTVLLNAPLQDPVKYKIMGYEISLRHSEAAMIEIISADEARRLEDEEAEKLGLNETPEKYSDDDGYMTDEQLHKAAMRQRRTINVALVGNPNCGKTSLFNFASGAHERVGNYSGVTVDAKEGKAEYGGYTFNLVDLPGTYSLSAYSPEELYVRKQIIENTPDVIINVIDASNLERNLYLTAQLVDMNLKIVGALNMFDEFESRGDKLDYDKLGELFGIPLVPTVFKNGRGVDELFKTVINVYEGESPLLANDNGNGCNAILQVNGIDIGFFGLTTADTATSVNPELLGGVTFADEAEAAEEQIDILSRAGVDAIVAVCHLGDESGGASCTAARLADQPIQDIQIVA